MMKDVTSNWTSTLIWQEKIQIEKYSKQTRFAIS